MTTPSTDYALIPLTKGQYAKVSPEDYDLVTSYQWYAKQFPKSPSFYAAQTGKRFGKGKGKTILMHRLILDLAAVSFPVVDHINGDTLDNRRCNLRPCTRSQNARNTSARRGSSTKFKGVEATKYGFVAKIALGTYATAEEAGRVYDEAAKIFHREFARLNFPEDPAPAQ